MDKPVCIDIVGSHSTGKTTCISHIKRLLKMLGFSYNEVGSTSRSEADKMFDMKDLYKNVGDFLQAWISLTNWANILESIQSYQFTLCTDLGVRSLAYTLSSPKTCSKTELAHKKIVDFFNSPLFLSTVDVYRIYLPIEFDIVPDGLRITDQRFQADFDTNLLYIFESCQIPIIKLNGSILERNQQLNDLITRITMNKCSLEYEPGHNFPTPYNCNTGERKSYSQ
jgi:nicotinamide riboside kinase